MNFDLAQTVRSGVRLGLAVALAAACASKAGVQSYRLGDTGPNGSRRAQQTVLADLREHYPAYFAVVLDPTSVLDPDLRPLERNLEKHPVDRENFDALNAVAIGYFEMYARTRPDPSTGERGSPYFADSFRTAKLIAVPSRAYGEILDPKLRDAILDFFADISEAQQPGNRRSRVGLARTVASLENKEPNPERKARIRQIVAGLGGAQARSASGDAP